MTFPDGKTKEYETGVTGIEIAKSIGRRLAEDALAIQVNGTLLDLDSKIEQNSEIRIITFKDKEGVELFRHSTAHILAYAIQQLYPEAKNTIGPPVEEGFYYDFDDLDIKQDDLPTIEKKMEEIAQQGLTYERKELTLEEVKKIFAKNKYKIEMASEFETGGQKLTAYTMGKDFLDLCRGPHTPNTKIIKAIKLKSVTKAYWRGDAKNKQLTRIYGISFPTKKEMDEHLEHIKQAELRDHRTLGKNLGLTLHHDWSPGSPFFLPKGTIIYNELVKFIRTEYSKRGYSEVITPQLFNKELWELSGHWEHYKNDMFTLKVDDQEFSLKPMNCPSHVLIFKSEGRSYRDLPLRIADFCMLHRNELKGVLGGLTRVRKFSQDDEHIFCTREQITEEIILLLDFVRYVYTEVFQFTYSVKLSTKPESAMGDPALWEEAEQALKKTLDEKNIPFVIKPGEGAFYGPKIDIDVRDALGRLWQVATIQLDFQMPLRMGATYQGADGEKHTPVMIHRAILGSIERFLGVLIEHYAGNFPLWLSPEQLRIVPVSDKFNEYAHTIANTFKEQGFRIHIDERSEGVSKKIRDAQLEKVNYAIVIGEKEQESKQLTIRTRDGKLHEMTQETFMKAIHEELREKKITSEF